jgi:type I restriction enzyme S subunit
VTTVLRNELPAGWCWSPLEEVATFQKGKLPRDLGERVPERPYPYIDIEAFEGGQINRYTSDDASPRCEPQDVLIVWDGARCGLVGRGVGGVIGSTLGCLRPTEIHAAYLFYFLRGLYHSINKNPRGVGIPHVDPERFWPTPMPIAPLPEQRRIVAEIETHLTRLDAAVAALKRAQANLKRYRASVLKAACEGRLAPTEAELARAEEREYEHASVLLERILMERETSPIPLRKRRGRVTPLSARGEGPGVRYTEPQPPDPSGLPDLPVGWSYTQLAPLFPMIRTGIKTGPFGSLLKKHEHREDGIQVLGIENVRAMKFIPGSKIHITLEKAQQLSEYDVRPGDVLVSRSGTVGETCVVPQGLGEARMSTNLMRICLGPNAMVPQFFCLLFKGSPTVLEQVTRLCGGSTRDFLNGDILRSLVFPLPPLAEQHRIISEVERHLSVIQAAETGVAANLKRAERLRQAILKRAFEGKLVPQDPNDEPASVLLERIRAERETSPNPLRARRGLSRARSSGTHSPLRPRRGAGGEVQEVRP